MDLSLIGMPLLFASIMAGRVLSERAFRSLPADQKVRIMDGFSRYRLVNIAPVLLLLVAYYLAIGALPQHARAVMVACFASLALHLGVSHVLIAKKLKELEAPRRYCRAVLAARWLAYAGFAAMIALLVLELGGP